METKIKRENFIRSLISLKHRSQRIINKKLSFPLPAADILLLTPIDLKDLNTDYQEILVTVKSNSWGNNQVSEELKKLPPININKYEISLLKRTLLFTTAWLFFFPLGIYIYYLVLSRRGKLKLQLTQIISTCHTLVHSIKE
jgi:hypothetical protein